MSNIISFKELLRNYKVEIPIIQRDYAHGRNEKTKQIAEKFLNDIKRKLESSETLHLDFIYGKIEERKEEGESIKVFIPIDGQQRLTLLFLLYLYLGKKEGQDIDFLKRFSYAVRVSSREFCKALVDKFEIPSENGRLISEYIKDKNWFFPMWEKDPTIKSMLKVLDLIYEKFKDGSVIFTDLEKITFEIFKLENFNLDEELYIRMNSRGRQLTNFEIFKAQFEEFLNNKNFRDELKEFSKKIDTTWTDFFWEHYREEYSIDDETYFAIDRPFLNFFYYLTEMLGYSTLSPEEENSETFYQFQSIEDIDFLKLFEMIYSKKENVEFLIKALNNLGGIRELNERIFGIYSLTEEDYKNNKGKLAIVKENEKTNLIDRVIKNSPKDLNLIEKFLLYVLISYKINGGNEEEKLKDLLRVARNLLVRVRTRKDNKIYYDLKLEKRDLYEMIQKFAREWLKSNIYEKLSAIGEEFKDTSISRESLEHEKEKAKIISKNPSEKEYIHKLEDHVYIKGDLRNFLWEGINFKQISERLYETFEKRKDEDIIPVLIILETKGNRNCYPLKIGNNKYFLGRKDYWDILLTHKELKNLWKDYFTHEDYANEFRNLREEFLKDFEPNSKQQNWQYYFVKYNKIFEEFKINENDSATSFKNDRNLFLLPPNCENLSLCIEKMRKDNANSYHLNPFIYYIAKELKLETGYVNCSGNRNGIHFGWARGEDFHSFLILDGQKFGFRCPKSKYCKDVEDRLVIECKELTGENEDLVEKLRKYIEQLTKSEKK